MAKVMIKCPTSGKPVFTGMAMDKSSFEVASLSRNSVKCPHCGNMHTWDKKDAYLVE